MTRKDRLTVALKERFNPPFLQVLDESGGHRNSAGESHYNVVVVSAAFTGVSRLGRHRLVNATVTEEFASGLHALTIHAFSPEESRADVPDSPPCSGTGSAR